MSLSDLKCTGHLLLSAQDATEKWERCVQQRTADQRMVRPRCLCAPAEQRHPGNQLYYGAVRNQRQRETDAKPSEYPICFRGAQSTPVVTANTLWDAGRSWKQSVPQDEKLRELNIPL